MTGIDHPYEVPEYPDLRLQMGVLSVDESVELLMAIDPPESDQLPSH